MVRYDARLARLERLAHGQSHMGEMYASSPLQEFVEAVEAAESETGRKILEVHPFALSEATGRAIADALLGKRWKLSSSTSSVHL